MGKDQGLQRFGFLLRFFLSLLSHKNVLIQLNRIDEGLKDLILSYNICLCSFISIITFHLKDLIKPFFEAKDGYTCVSLLSTCMMWSVYLSEKYLVNTYYVPSSGFVRASQRNWIEPCRIDISQIKKNLNITNRHGFALTESIIQWEKQTNQKALTTFPETKLHKRVTQASRRGAGEEMYPMQKE